MPTERAIDRKGNVFPSANRVKMNWKRRQGEGKRVSEGGKERKEKAVLFRSLLIVSAYFQLTKMV